MRVGSVEFKRQRASVEFKKVSVDFDKTSR